MIRSIASFSLAAALLAAVPAAADAPEIYARDCAACHGADRLGGIGPALIAETLKRMRGPDLADVIANGRPATQMPGFAATLSESEIAGLAAYLETPLATMPRWTEADIAATLARAAEDHAAEAPVFDADPLNLFVVVETGDHHVSILDGDTFEVLQRLPTPFAVHGGPKFTPDGRYTFIMSRDGWVQKIDLWGLAEVARVRAGLNSRNIAISSDGRWLAVANYLPTTLTILSTDDLSVARVFDVRDRAGNPSRVSAVYQAPARASFILALKDAAEVWEIATDSDAPPVFEGFVHSYEAGMVEALGGEEGIFALRRIAVETPIDDFFFTPNYQNLIGAARDGERAVVVNLIVGREIAELPLSGLPHLGSGIAWTHKGRPVMATPHLKEARLSVIDTNEWEVIDTIETLGPGFFLRSHETSSYVWSDVFFGLNRDVMHVIDKQSLEIVKTLRPAPGATVAHTEFDRDGSHALVSVWEDDGAVIVYDARTLQEVRRLPMKKPSGKYNVFNKIMFDDGTSH